ncbi:23 kDa integral membrane protein [Galendromus occidentalis]|uniref:Tetraspanin n=1 Tax=Galendromus occidentalis TaxID=34638 RepID=A0AAJ6QWM4_9ACAR|nr:23 kDa integral membrane protein [Galendromus occidentalis]
MVASMCGLFCLKCLLYILNTILTIMSIVIVCVGAGVLFVLRQVDGGGTPDFDLAHLSTAGILIVIVGVLIVLFVFCGCCGAFLGAGWMLIWFAVIMGCLLIVECVILGFAWKYSEPSKLEEVVSATYSALLDGAVKTRQINEQAQAGAAALLNFFQDKLECCGDVGQSDYSKRGLDFRDFCQRPNNNGYYSRGCTKVTVDFFQKHSHTMGGVVVGTMAFQLLAICLAIFLYFTIA